MKDFQFVSADAIRSRFSEAMSSMYRAEVPLYGELLDLVADVNAKVLQTARLHVDSEVPADDLVRLGRERHGAIRLGTARELSEMRRVFAVMGMKPVGYYDLSAAGLPVHSTAFRPVTDEALEANPFRVFTSLLRLDLIADAQLREHARVILERRRIFTARAMELTGKCEEHGGLDHEDAAKFVAEVLETFRWHGRATVGLDVYQQMHSTHGLLADIVCFRGPHINHLTPRTLDIDAAQSEMLTRAIPAKEVVEGPPRRRHPILLRQTSFKAMEERVTFEGDSSSGTHTARFGEIEQRGMALTRKGRVLYDTLLSRARQIGDPADSEAYQKALDSAFQDFPDDLNELRRAGLAFFRYRPAAIDHRAIFASAYRHRIEELIDRGVVLATPIL